MPEKSTVQLYPLGQATHDAEELDDCEEREEVEDEEESEEEDCELPLDEEFSRYSMATEGNTLGL